MISSNCLCLQAFKYLLFILLVQKLMEIDPALMLFCLYVLQNSNTNVLASI